MIDYEILQDIITDHELCKVQENELSKVVELLKSDRLIELPCKVGDTVWKIATQRDNYDDHEYKIVMRSSFRLDFLPAMGKTIFLTKEEAEAKLAENDGNK